MQVELRAIGLGCLVHLVMLDDPDLTAIAARSRRKVVLKRWSKRPKQPPKLVRRRSLRRRRLPVRWFFDVTIRIRGACCSLRRLRTHKIKLLAQAKDAEVREIVQVARREVATLKTLNRQVSEDLDKRLDDLSVSRALSDREKADLQEKIDAFDGEQLKRVLSLLHEDLGCVQDGQQVVDLDVDALPGWKQWRFLELVDHEFRQCKRRRL